MGLKGKLLRQIEISFHGDVFHEIYRDRPHHVPSMCPIVVGVEGQWGTVGSIIIWKFTHDGETKTASEVIESIDDEKKMMKFRVIGGDDVLEYYKSFIITYQVDTNSDGNFVSWSIEYEKLKEEIPEPLTYLELLLNITKDIDNHHAKLLNP
ncbi:PREDICTED: kirola-like [Ipomoea nil]|uniref:kirola-like n=1 Tax=Ipomoea nil TaxID=35883 RepID=UPI0009013B3A|nr:PREDICTED: kirola-like [Ipomoea nil]